jgi:AcrR family transcriptional regulator
MAGTRHTDLHTAIRQTAWRQIAERGAAALSLRAIARELGITAPAIYNYYPRRDDLVTALVVDAFTSFGDAQVGARDATASADAVDRLRALGVAYRRWALANVPRYQLIFGAPLPGYEPPIEQVQPAGARALGALVGLMQQLRADGRLRGATDLPGPGPGCPWPLDAWGTPDRPVHPEAVTVALIVWARVHGLVSLEIAGHLPPFDDPDALYSWELTAIVQQFVKEEP